METAIHSLHSNYPGEYRTAVDTPHNEIFAHHPHVEPLSSGRVVDLSAATAYPPDEPQPFSRLFVDRLAAELNRPIPPTCNRPHVYLSDDELRPVFPDLPERYIVFNAGCKKDFTAKRIPPDLATEIVAQCNIPCVQIGARKHDHPRIAGAIDFVGKTSLRQLFRLIHDERCVFGFGPSTLIQHIHAAVQKPYLCLLGGRESPDYQTYPTQINFHTIGRLACCQTAACQLARVVPLNDGSKFDRLICKSPDVVDGVPVAKCMRMFSLDEILYLIRRVVG